MNIPAELKGILSQEPEVMGGVICFTGTRIPVSILLDNLRAGVSLHDVYDAYPSLTPELVEPVLRCEKFILDSLT